MKKKNTIALATLGACMFIAVTNSAWAATSLGVNFAGRDPGFALLPTETAGVVPQANWHNIPGGDGIAGNSGSTGPLTDAGNGFTSVTLNYQASESWHSDGTSTTP